MLTYRLPGVKWMEGEIDDAGAWRVMEVERTKGGSARVLRAVGSGTGGVLALVKEMRSRVRIKVQMEKEKEAK